MGAGPAPTDDSGQAALLALSNALTLLARRLRSSSLAADDFARLMARAQGIAARAREVRTTRWAFIENAAKLADDLVAFADETEASSARAAAMVSDNASVIETLESHASRIAALHTDVQSGTASRRLAIRAELEPLESTLGALRARLAVEHSASEEAKTLALRASDLAGCASGLRGGGRSAEAAADEIHRALSLFVTDAEAVAQRIARAATSTGMAVAHLVPGATKPDARAGRIAVGVADGLQWSRRQA